MPLEITQMDLFDACGISVQDGAALKVSECLDFVTCMMVIIFQPGCYKNRMHLHRNSVKEKLLIFSLFVWMQCASKPKIAKIYRFSQIL